MSSPSLPGPGQYPKADPLPEWERPRGLRREPIATSPAEQKGKRPAGCRASARTDGGGSPAAPSRGLTEPRAASLSPSAATVNHPGLAATRLLIVGPLGAVTQAERRGLPGWGLGQPAGRTTDGPLARQGRPWGVGGGSLRRRKVASGGLKGVFGGAGGGGRPDFPLSQRLFRGKKTDRAH